MPGFLSFSHRWGEKRVQVIPVACEEEVAGAGELVQEGEHVFRTGHGRMV